MTAPRYSEEVRRRCREMRRAGAWATDDAAVATGRYDDRAADARIEVQLRIEDGLVVDSRFKAFGCSAAIASASVVADRAAGRLLADVREIDAATVMRALELPDDKAALAAGAVAAAVAAADDWEARLADRADGRGRR